MAKTAVEADGGDVRTGLDIPAATTPAVLMSNQQLEVARLIKSSAENPPHITVTDLEHKDLFAVPFRAADDYPDRVYKWCTPKDRCLGEFGGDYVPVTRTNHPQVRNVLFDDRTGAVLHPLREHFLCWTRRENREARDRHVTRNFVKALEAHTNPNEREYKGENGRGSVIVHGTDKASSEGMVIDSTPDDFEG